MSKKWVYIAGPYSSDPVKNTGDAIDQAEDLSRHGFHPIIPHVCLLWHFRHEHDYQFWMDWGDELLKKCDAVLRFPGYSPGADIEVAAAKQYGIPVFLNLSQLVQHFE
jgi:hypothetical protein